MRFQELHYDGVGLGRVVAAEGGGDPLLGEEDVAGSLDILQGFQGRADVTEGFFLAERVVEKTERGLHPGFVAPVLWPEQGLEDAVADGPVRRDGRPDEIELAEAVGMADAPALGVKDFRGAVRKPDGKFQGEGRIVRLAERHAGESPAR